MTVTGTCQATHSGLASRLPGLALVRHTEQSVWYLSPSSANVSSLKHVRLWWVDAVYGPF